MPAHATPRLSAADRDHLRQNSRPARFLRAMASTSRPATARPMAANSDWALPLRPGKASRIAPVPALPGRGLAHRPRRPTPAAGCASGVCSSRRAARSGPAIAGHGPGCSRASPYPGCPNVQRGSPARADCNRQPDDRTAASPDRCARSPGLSGTRHIAPLSQRYAGVRAAALPADHPRCALPPAHRFENAGNRR
ncbi:hypothetical protein D9M73_160090 [compost metagenome]